MKDALRVELRKKRKEYSGLHGDIDNIAVQRRLIELLEKLNPRTLHCYRSQAFSGEVDTLWLQNELRYNVTFGEARRDASLPQVQYDVVIVPLLAFDSVLHRIGYGGGWYDRFLITQQHAIFVGLAYDMQRVEHIQAEKHDIALDYVVTPTQLFMKSASRQ